jgi:hypothetical protein
VLAGALELVEGTSLEDRLGAERLAPSNAVSTNGTLVTRSSGVSTPQASRQYSICLSIPDELVKVEADGVARALARRFAAAINQSPAKPPGMA